MTTAANTHSVRWAENIVHGEMTDVLADSAYRGLEMRKEAAKNPHWACVCAKKGNSTLPSAATASRCNGIDPHEDNSEREPSIF